MIPLEKSPANEGLIAASWCLRPAARPTQVQVHKNATWASLRVHICFDELQCPRQLSPEKLARPSAGHSHRTLQPSKSRRDCTWSRKRGHQQGCKHLRVLAGGWVRLAFVSNIPLNTHLHAMHSGYVRLKLSQSKAMGGGRVSTLVWTFQLASTLGRFSTSFG